jgi:hypothetical protein
MVSGLVHVLFPAALLLGAEGDPIVITDKLHHIGDTEKPEWKEHTTVKPTHRRDIEIEFEARESSKKHVLEIQAGGVGIDWRVEVNSKDLGDLRKVEELTTQYFEVPGGTLRNGRNRLTIESRSDGDDIYVGKAILHDRPMREFRGHARVHASVRDADTGEGIPSRITITKLVEKKEKVKEKGEDGKEREVEKTKLVEEYTDAILEETKGLAVRKGVLYTKKGKVTFDLPPGKYTIYATRGFEYGVHAAKVELGRLEERPLDMTIRREVDTTGLLAADTHVHTKTHSGHGDIDMEERVITIAGEGVELAVATDHNHHTDYRPTMEKEGVREEFRSIIGNEVSTPIGHFNAFPFEKDAEPPDHDHTDWVKLIQAMRAGSGVRVIIVNHPRREASGQNAFHRIRLNPLSGEAHNGPEKLGIDAVEILNGKTLDDNRMLTLNDWFGILNRGQRIAAVAASDSHSVNEIVGQARTYVASRTDDPRRIRIDEVCDSFLAGRLLPSLGLLTRIEVNGKHTVGDLATELNGQVEVKVTVHGPSWTHADKVSLYQNGIEVWTHKVEPTEKPLKFSGSWYLPELKHDAFLVAVATGPAVTALYWPIAGGEKKYVMGATNPVWLDGDGDGKYTAAFEYASSIAEKHGLAGEAVHAALARHDAAVAIEFASIARSRIEKEAQEAYARLMTEADQKIAGLLEAKEAGVKKAFGDYVAASPKIDVKTRRDADAEAARLKKEEEDRQKRKKEAAEKKKKEAEEKRRKERKRAKL